MKTKETTEAKQKVRKGGFKDALLRGIMFALDRREFTLLGMIIVMSVALSCVSKTFLTPANFNVMLNSISTDLIVAIPMAFCLMSGHTDFSVGANVCLSSMIACLAMQAGVPIPVGILIALVCGAFCGFLMGAAVNKLKVPAFVATLGGMYAYRGIAMVLCGANTVGGFDKAFLNLGRFTVAGIRAPILYAAIVVLVGMFASKYVNFFHNAYYIGSNQSSAILAGINAKKYIYISYSLTGLFCGIAGVVLAARVGSVSVATTTDLHFKNIVGLMVGGVSGGGGTGSIIGGVLGILFMQLIDNALVQLYVDPN